MVMMYFILHCCVSPSMVIRLLKDYTSASDSKSGDWCRCWPSRA